MTSALFRRWLAASVVAVGCGGAPGPPPDPMLDTAEGAFFAEYQGKTRQDLPLLLRWTKNKDATIRARATYYLGQMGEDAADAVPALASLLRDPHREVRLGAVHAIATLRRSVAAARSPEVTAALNALAKDRDDDVRALAAKAVVEPMPP